jgi:hypothetical protein
VNPAMAADTKRPGCATWRPTNIQYAQTNHSF